MIPESKRPSAVQSLEEQEPEVAECGFEPVHVHVTVSPVWIVVVVLPDVESRKKSSATWTFPPTASAGAGARAARTMRARARPAATIPESPVPVLPLLHRKAILPGQGAGEAKTRRDTQTRMGNPPFPRG